MFKGDIGNVSAAEWLQRRRNDTYFSLLVEDRLPAEAWTKKKSVT